MDGGVFATQTVDELYKQLDTNSHGLSEGEVIKRRQLHGANILENSKTYWWHILLRQFTSPFVYLLFSASVLSFLLNARIDGLMILLFVGINSFLGFYQEYRSEQALKLLRKYIVSKAKVIRDEHEVEVDSADLVPGDILMLEAGDLVPADIRIIEETNFTVDESVLTGESNAVNKSAAVLGFEPKQIYKAENLCFSGTTVATGKAKAIVLTIGKKTAIGQIAKLTTETHRESSFEKGIAKFSKFILYLIVITLTGIFFINLLVKGSAVNIPTLLIFSIALAVSVIPEALPVVITFSLSAGALRLAKNKVIVKRLSAIEDLGNIEVLCTDKTGTLTRNILTVDHIFATNSLNPRVYAAAAAPLTKQHNPSVHSFDTALLSALSDSDKKELSTFEKIEENPFDPERKRSSMLVKANGHYELIVRGATEEIIKVCKNLDKKDVDKIEKWIKSEAGNRVIAVAKKNVSLESKTALLKEERDLEFVGLISFIDPIKPTTIDAVDKAKKLGLKIKILTGDSREVAGFVAHQIGLIADPDEVITGDEFIALSTEKQLEAVEKYAIFARVSPQQKYLIIQLLQEKHEVGFLGEGINDAPALKIANVSLVVQEATDVAREASDIILLKKSLQVIIDGIHEGRLIFANTSKYIKATLSSNFGNFYTVAIASLFINFLPLLPLQILLINLLTDFPMIAVATDTVDPQEVEAPRAYNVKEFALVGTILGIVSSFFDFIFFVLFFRISPSVLQTNWFMGSVLTELLFLFSIRTKLPLWKARPPSLPLVLFSGMAFLTAIVLPFTPVGHSVFGFVTPSLINVYMILSIVIAYFVTTEIVKLLYYKNL